MLHKYGKYSLLKYSHFYVPAFFSFPSAGILLLFLSDLQIMILIFFFWLAEWGSQNFVHKENGVVRRV